MLIINVILVLLLSVLSFNAVGVFSKVIFEVENRPNEITAPNLMKQETRTSELALLNKLKHDKIKQDNVRKTRSAFLKFSVPKIRDVFSFIGDHFKLRSNGNHHHFHHGYRYPPPFPHKDFIGHECHTYHEYKPEIHDHKLTPDFPYPHGIHNFPFESGTEFPYPHHSFSSGPGHHETNEFPDNSPHGNKRPEFESDTVPEFPKPNIQDVKQDDKSETNIEEVGLSNEGGANKAHENISDPTTNEISNIFNSTEAFTEAVPTSTLESLNNGISKPNSETVDTHFQTTVPQNVTPLSEKEETTTNSVTSTDGYFVGDFEQEMIGIFRPNDGVTDPESTTIDYVLFDPIKGKIPNKYDDKDPVSDFEKINEKRKQDTDLPKKFSMSEENLTEGNADKNSSENNHTEWVIIDDTSEISRRAHDSSTPMIDVRLG